MGYAKGWKLVPAKVRSAPETDEKVRYGAQLSTCGSVVHIMFVWINNRRRIIIISRILLRIFSGFIFVFFFHFKSDFFFSN